METSWADALASLESPSPLLRQWALEASLQPSVLELLAESLMRAGAITSHAELLPYLDELLKNTTTRHGHITWSDIDGLTVWGKFASTLRKHLGEDAPVAQDLYLAHGALGHLAIPDLFTRPISARTRTHLATPQMELAFTNGHGETIPFSFVDDSLPYVPQLATHTVDVRQALWRAHRFWKDHHAHCVDIDTPSRRELLSTLRGMLSPIFGAYMERLEAHPYRDEVVTFWTLMSWASALHMCLKNPERIFFSEVALSDPTHGFTGGRLDALEVQKVGGKRLTTQQRAFLRSIAKQRFRSSGYLLRAIEAIAPQRLELKVIDWKFAVGDGGPSHMLSLEHIRLAPDKKHYAQVSRYLSLMLLDRALLTGRARADMHVWEQSRHRIEGELVYFFPNAAPIVHPVRLDHDALQEAFDQQIALRYQSGKFRADVRSITRIIDGHVREVVSQKRSRSHKGMLETHPTLFHEHKQSALPFIAHARARHYQPCDEHGILWRIPRVRDGKESERFELRLDALITALDEGTVDAGSFVDAHGGAIGCLMPAHNERTPSFHIYLDGQPRFYCFGCGVKGIVAQDSIPANIIIAPKIRSAAGWRKSDLPVISSDHHDALELAQVLLSSHFKGSASERYLYEERGIDPDLAYASGAGHLTDRLVHGMMDAGYTLDELTSLGLVAFSEAVREGRGIVPMLKKRGLSVEEMRRPCKPSKRKASSHKAGRGSVWGLPYATLSDRVTFPLTLEGRMTSFYGRALRSDARLKHFKTKRPSGIPQGGYRTHVLSEYYDEIILCEAAIDALSLMMMGHHNVCALIGVMNHVTASAIARGRKNVAIALDRDTISHTGEKRTWDIGEVIAPYGVYVRDFTGAFLESLPECERDTFKDYNQWWVDWGRKNHSTQK